MRIKGRTKNQLAKHYLIQWHELDSNIQYLSEVEEVNIRILYTSLKQLGSEEVAFLSRKYQVPKRVPDHIMAEREGLSLREYRKRRINIETRLMRHIEKARADYKYDLDRAIYAI